MGCDIHLYAEKKIDGEWWALEGPELYDRSGKTKSFNCLYGTRSYELFALLADVRNNDGIQPIDDPRGSPEDVSYFLMDMHSVDHHSHSYFSLAELKEHDFRDFPNFYNSVIKRLEKLNQGEDEENIRIVFWFDN